MIWVGKYRSREGEDKWYPISVANTGSGVIQESILLTYPFWHFLSDSSIYMDALSRLANSTIESYDYRVTQL
jgi:hypothetical protein